MDPEARFLRNQQARLASLSSLADQERRQERHRVHSALKQRLGEWKDRVQQTASESTDASSKKESWRNLQRELDDLRHQALNDTDISMADVRAWHESLTEHQQFLDMTTEKHQFQKRFSFRRYREAYERQEQRRRLVEAQQKDGSRQADVAETPADVTPLVRETVEVETPLALDAIHDVKGALVEIRPDGSVAVDGTTVEGLDSPLHISNVSDCTINM